MPLIDFLKMDYDKLQQYLYEQWDEDIDTKTSATGMRLLKVLSSIGFMNIVYLKKSFNNALFSGASDRNIVVKKARAEKGYKCLPTVSAYVNIIFTVANTHLNTIIIPKWTKITTQSLTPNYTYYTIEDATIPVGSTTVDVLAVEGSRVQFTFMATGGNYESFEIKRSDITLRELEVYVNGTKWDMINDFIDASPTDYTWSYEPGNDGKINIFFGNNFYGKKLSSNDVITIWCLVSSGYNGNIKSSSITKVDSVIYDSTNTIVDDIVCNNPNKSYGGTGMEDISDIISNSYSSLKSNWGLITLNSYKNTIINLPGVDRVDCIDINTSLNIPFRQVWCYIVDSNGNDVGDPYRTEIVNYVEEHKVVGTEFVLKSILYKNYVVDIDVWINLGYNPSAVITKITDLINTKYSKPGMTISTSVELTSIKRDLSIMDEIVDYEIILPTTDIEVPDGYLANVVGVNVTVKGII